MIQCIALLRAVNVGGRSLAMSDLRDMLTGLGLGNPRTALQSGNAVFAIRTKTSLEALERKLEREARERFGTDIAFILRSAAQWRALIEHNPFADAADRDPAHLLVMALKVAPDADAIDALRAAYRGPESIHVHGREAYLVYPNGVGRSKLTGSLLERKLGVTGTARNWNTVLKLTALATG